ncbi:MAG: hypothetical protein RR253_02055 [Oscillospiraceae bacterium]
MALKKITANDLAGKGVIGMADTPQLTALELQKKIEEVVREVVIPTLNANVEQTVSPEILAAAIGAVAKDEFSLGEVRTNKVWRDGTPIYRKVIDIPSVSATKTVPHGIVALKSVTSLMGVMAGSDGSMRPMPVKVGASQVDFCLKGSDVALIGTGDMSVFSGCFVVVEYTKNGA